MVERVGQQLGNYRLIRLLGHGGFADVYLGKHLHLGTQTAIKVLHTQLGSTSLDTFRAEARTVAMLEHPHIVRVLEFGIENAFPFLVMDYAPNGTLRQLHPKETQLPLETIISYVNEIADALQYAHGEKLIHRDIKPENMLVSRRESILLSDFGIAVAAHRTHSMSLQNEAGTVLYMAPEQIQGKARPASDQYALGAVVYEWLSGSPPFTGASTVEIAMKHLSDKPLALQRQVPFLSPAVAQVIMKALAKDPQQRFPQVQDFAHALEEASYKKQRHGSSRSFFSPLQSQSLLSTLRPQDAHLMEEEALADSPPLSTTLLPRRNPTKRGNAPNASSAQEKSPLGRKAPPSPMKFRRRNILWFLAGNISVIMLIALIGGLFLQSHYDDLHYGSPRTFQIDVVVGHGGDSSLHPSTWRCKYVHDLITPRCAHRAELIVDSFISICTSHFVAVNLNRQAIVVEFPAGNPAGAESYVVPYYILGPGGDQVPVTLEFRDVTADGKLDMIIHIHFQSQDQTFVFINDGTKFRPPTSKDNIHM